MSLFKKISGILNFDLETASAFFFVFMALGFFALSVLTGLMPYLTEGLDVTDVIVGLSPTITAVLGTVVFIGALKIFASLKKDNCIVTKFDRPIDMLRHHY